MRLNRLLMFAAMFVIANAVPTLSQERWQRLPPSRDAQFYAPRNKLEEFESRTSTLLIKGRTWVATLRSTAGGSAPPRACSACSNEGSGLGIRQDS